MIVPIIIFIVVLLAKLNLDAYLHFHAKTIHHKTEALIVAALIGASCYFSLHDWIVPFIQLLLILWASFDSFFGIIIARDWLYLGHSSWLDRLQLDYPLIHILKYVAAICSIIYFFV